MMSEAWLERKESFVVPLSFWSRVASMKQNEAIFPSLELES